MFRAALKSLLARKLRLLMSAFAIVLGVAFVAGSFIFTDTLNKSFNEIMAGSVGDVVVRPSGGNGDDWVSSSKTIPADLVEQLADVDGAARADGNVMSYGVFVVGQDGKVIGAQGAPGMGVNYNDAPAAGGAGFTLIEGRFPQRAGEIALDSQTAEKAGYTVGDTVPLVTSGKQPSLSEKLVGIAEYGGGSLGGASLTVFDTGTAQELFLNGKNEYTDAWVTAADGVSQQELVGAVRAELPAGVEAVTGEKAADEAASDITEALGFINTFLLVFAGIALFVGSFLIVNTFSILVAQRGRELALFRALGASRRQVVRSVLVEAFAIGLIGSTLGLLLGFGLAQALKAIFAAFGLDTGGMGLTLELRTVLVSYAVGLGVTAVAAYLPARRAGKVPPVAALRDDVAMPEGSLRRRLLIGVSLMVLGGAGMLVGLFATVSNGAWIVGGGALLVLLGAALISPVIGRPLMAVLGGAFRRLYGAVGVLAGQNAVRNPRRTAATASALMIGLALVSAMAVIGQSAKASVDNAIAKTVQADYVVSNAIGVPFSPTIAEQVQRVPGVESVARFRFATAEVDGERSSIVASDPADLAQTLDVTMVEGELTDLRGRDGVLVASDRADRDQLAIGDTVPITLPNGTTRFRVDGIYEEGPVLASNFLVTLDALEAGGVTPADNYAYVLREPGADADQVTAGIERVIEDLPTVTLKDQAEFAAEQRGPVDQLLTLIYGLLGLAVVIAVLGIVNTLALSVIERTREVGLLRAVGLSRRQLRRMVRLESVAIAVLGASLGVVLGVVFGLVLLQAASDDGLSVIQVPYVQLLGFLVASLVIGVLAAVWPARRAAKLDVLQAITTE